MSVKIIKKGGIDMNSFGTRRNLGFNRSQFDEYFKDCETRPAPVNEPTITTLPEEMRPKPPTKKELMLPFVGDDGEYIWTGTDKFPKLIQDVCKVIKSTYGLGKEINGYNIRVFPPAAKKNHKHITSILRVPQEAAMAIGARIIFPVGSTENFKVEVSASKSQRGEGEVKLVSGEGIMIGIGMVAGADFRYDDGNTIQVAQRKGFRKTHIKKNPVIRYVVVVDCLNDVSVISGLIKEQADKNSDGNDEKSKIAEDLLRKSMGLSSVEDIANEAKKCEVVDLMRDLNSLNTEPATEYIPIENEEKPTPKKARRKAFN